MFSEKPQICPIASCQNDLPKLLHGYMSLNKKYYTLDMRKMYVTFLLLTSWLVGGCGRMVAVVDVDGRGGCGAAALPDGGRGKAGEDCPRSASHCCLYLGQRLNIWN